MSKDWTTQQLGRRKKIKEVNTRERFIWDPEISQQNRFINEKRKNIIYIYI